MGPSLGLAANPARSSEKQLWFLCGFSHFCLNGSFPNQCCYPPQNIFLITGNPFCYLKKKHTKKKQVWSPSEKVNGIYFMFFNLAYLSVWERVLHKGFVCCCWFSAGEVVDELLLLSQVRTGVRHFKFPMDLIASFVILFNIMTWNT